MSDPTISEKVERCQRLMAADGTLAAPRATECPTMQTFLAAHFDANPEATPEAVAKTWAEVMKNPLVGGIFKNLRSIKDLIQNLGPIIEQIKALIEQFKQFCPQAKDQVVGCQGALCSLLKLCLPLPCACGDGACDCLSQFCKQDTDPHPKPDPAPKPDIV